MITLFLSGDVMTGRGIDQILAHPGDPTLHESYVKDARQYVELAEQKNGPISKPVADDALWGFAREVFAKQKPAAKIINLETAVTISPDYWKGKGVHYRMSPENVGCLTAAGVDCCTLANNHVMDWGDAGLAETLQTLKAAGITTAGAGENLEEAKTPAVLPAGTGNRILVFGLAASSSGVPPAWAAADDRPGVAFLPDCQETSIAETIEWLNDAPREESDVVTVSIHWGGNWEYEIPKGQRELARRLIDEAGVDLVHGHSSHHVKGLEVYRDRLILYGCGDLITDYEGISGAEAFGGDLGLLYFPKIDPQTGRLESLEMHPTQIRHMQLGRPSKAEVAWLADVLNREGGPVGTQVRQKDDGYLELVRPPK